MGVTEEGGKVAAGVVDALKANPSCLLALLFALILAGLVYLSFRDFQETTAERTRVLIERCFPLQEDEKA